MKMKTMTALHGGGAPETGFLKGFENKCLTSGQNNVNIPNMLGTAKRKNNKSAFTLAEVLITLGIIGIVAALTMPSLIQKHNERVTVTKVKKAYNILNNAYQLAILDNGHINDWGTNVSDVTAEGEVESDASAYGRERFFDVLSPYLKVTGRCKNYKTNNNCEVWELKYLHGSLFKSDANHNFMKLADGTVITDVYLGSVGTNCVNAKSPSCGDITIDINGKKPPNTAGKDVFNFIIKYDAILPQGIPSYIHAYKFEDYCNKDKTNNYNGWSCSAWIIINENMDYLHCSDLDWNDKKSCKDK